MPSIDPDSCAQVRDAVGHVRRLLLVKGVYAALTVAAAVLLVPGPLVVTFALTGGGLAALAVLVAYARLPLKDLFPECSIVEATADTSGIAGEVWRAVHRAAAAADVREPRTFVIVGGVAPVAFSRYASGSEEVIINGIYAARFPEDVPVLVTHEVAHIALGHYRTMRKVHIVEGLPVWLGLAAGACAVAGVIGMFVASSAWLGYAARSAVLLAIAVAAVKAPSPSLKRLGHLHEFAADGYGAMLYGGTAAATKTLWNIMMVVGNDDGPDSGDHPFVFDRIKRLIRAQKDEEGRT